MGNIILKVDHLGRTYPGKVATVALKDVSLSIQEGEFMAIMGKSGSGKSTLLHCLGLLDEPTKGTISIQNQDVLALTSHQKTNYRLTKLGYIFQEYAIIPELTALENVYLPISLVRGKTDKERKAQAQQMLEQVDLGHRLHHYPNELSGGEQQRVAIARALVNKPMILFADEPFANLDTVSSERVLALLKQLNKTRKQTIIMVTHEREDKKWVDRVIYLKDGLVEKEEKVHH